MRINRESKLPPLPHHAVTKPGINCRFNLKNREIFSLPKTGILAFPAFSPAKMAAIARSATRTDKPARRIPFKSCSFPWKSKTYSSNKEHRSLALALSDKKRFKTDETIRDLKLVLLLYPRSGEMQITCTGLPSLLSIVDQIRANGTLRKSSFSAFRAKV